MEIGGHCSTGLLGSNTRSDLGDSLSERASEDDP